MPWPPLENSLQVVTEYSEGELPLVLEALERMTNHLTAAIVSNDINFVQHVLGNSVSTKSIFSMKVTGHM